MRILVLGLLAFSALAQNTPVFPGRAATNQDLFIGTNNAATTLASSIGTTDTLVPVGDPSVFTAPLVVSIDNEIISVCGISGSNLQVGKSSCPNVDGRGFDGTSAASHTIRASVQGRITAWLHNQVAAEVIALEAGLKPAVVSSCTDNWVIYRYGGTIGCSATLTFDGTRLQFGTGPYLYTSAVGRIVVQPSGTNLSGFVAILPSGNSAAGILDLHNASDVNNSARIRLGMGGATAFLKSQDVGTAATPITVLNIGSGPSLTAMNFLDGPGTTRATVDANGFGVAATTASQAVVTDANNRLASVAGISGTVTVRNSAGSGTCTLIFTTGIYTGGSC